MQNNYKSTLLQYGQSSYLKRSSPPLRSLSWGKRRESSRNILDTWGHGAMGTWGHGAMSGIVITPFAQVTAGTYGQQRGNNGPAAACSSHKRHPSSPSARRSW